VINQTDSEKVLELTVAYRPEPNKSPIALNDTIHKITLEPRSMRSIDLVENCPVMLVSVIIKGIKGDTVSTTKSMTCYEPYPYKGQGASLFDDSWGIVVHKPLPAKPSVRGFDFARHMALKDGYGIKCMHPNLLEQTTVDELPSELK